MINKSEFLDDKLKNSKGLKNFSTRVLLEELRKRNDYMLCDLCAYNSPSSMNGKACSICPATNSYIE